MPSSMRCRRVSKKPLDGMLGDTCTYKKLNKDPTPALQRKMNQQLLVLKRKKELSEPVYNELRCSSGEIPRIYGLPKIHKAGNPLRPIVSFLTSPTYNLSKHLAKVLDPLVGNTLSAVRNSYEFSEFVRTQVLDEAERLISFDVISLFTRIPVNLAISVAKFRLENDNTLQDRTCLSVSSIVSLLRLCLEATYFSFRGEIYQQVFGTAMGSPVSVIVTNLVMEDAEERALNSYPNPPKFWKRYVDDVCVAMKKDKIYDFLSHLNSIELTIQFTVETEDDDNTLPFLE